MAREGLYGAMWRELIEHLGAEATFRPPATLEQVQNIQSRLGVTLPAELQDLLLETNGAEVAYGTRLIWAAEDIIQHNLDMRREWQRGDWAGVMPFDHLLFFGELGNGDYLFLPITAEEVGNRVFRWDHEDDSRMNSGASLTDWLRGRGQTF